MELKIGRIKFKISFAFTVSLALILGMGDTAGFLISFMCCCVHELLHLLLFAAFGAFPKSITLGIAGMRMDFGGEIPVSFVKEAAASCIPALFNAGLGCVFTVLYSRGNSFFLLPAASNLVLGAINLFPVRALDGGRTLWCLFSSRFSPETADRLLKISELLLLPVLLFTIIRSFALGSGNISIPLLCFYVILLISVKKT